MAILGVYFGLCVVEMKYVLLSMNVMGNVLCDNQPGGTSEKCAFYSFFLFVLEQELT